MSQENGISSFASDVLQGLSGIPKRIPIKYGYDDIGSRIYQQICAMPEYYVTNCELEILSKQASRILNSVGFHGKFNVVDLGCGDGSKVLKLLQEFQKRNADFSYIPMDISAEAVESMKVSISGVLPDIPMSPHVGDFYSILSNIQIQESQNLFLLLGATIGNYTKSEAIELLSQIKRHMRAGDKILIGHDLRSKSPSIIQRAYDDPTGFEKAYNVNLIRRIRSELALDVEVENFDYYVSYNPETGELRGYLLSLKPQIVFSKLLNTTFNFEEWETVGTMFAMKYTLHEFTSMASDLELNLVEHFLDSKSYFSCSLLEKGQH